MLNPAESPVHPTSSPQSDTGRYVGYQAKDLVGFEAPWGFESSLDTLSADFIIASDSSFVGE